MTASLDPSADLRADLRADLPAAAVLTPGAADSDALLRLAQAFHANGFVILRGFGSEADCAALEAVARRHLAAVVPPVEFEADLGYPGAPAARDAAGGGTVRRLRQAYGRDEVFHDWATAPKLVSVVQALLGEPACLTLAHHNCVMTKHPHYGSQTGWHRDTRYWSFAKPELVTVWLALGDEDESNGVLRVIPGSHRAALEPGQLDPAEFLIEAHPASQPLLQAARPLALHRGDVLFFDSRLFHAAGRNASNAVKLSVAFAYFGASNRPLDGTRSAEFGSVALPVAG
ncbi:MULTISPECIES: phytanoyl-CoA dioxygenase family protein [Cupriavidus]|uniref:Phytanoyl-CoA dioxygenase family protein n=1 Tax=Cupriavidus oxalaticus TaxID=96344 RepID=A0A4P7L626_9BURK|nr:MULTISPECIES: phytanoyl-CoA dioxygenase family protein [Cupriavidus]MBF6988382.1 phytanoyl-CoA dioxygenase family protein [Cupriavidus sp. IK-TO18]QBY50880.1 phytanoyl-CoA dioxygenase family protein [Cupriavidus oxalaticus]